MFSTNTGINDQTLLNYEKHIKTITEVIQFQHQMDHILVLLVLYLHLFMFFLISEPAIKDIIQLPPLKHEVTF